MLEVINVHNNLCFILFFRYKTNLEEARKAGLKKSLVCGGRMGLFIFMVFCVCATAFWYGSKLVREDPDYDDISIVSLIIVDFCRFLKMFF